MINQGNQQSFIVISLTAVLSMLVIAFVNSLTQGTISSNKFSSEKEELLKLIPKSYHNGEIEIESLMVPRAHWASLGLTSEGSYHIIESYGNPVAKIIPAIGKGYSGDIKILVSVDMSGSVIDVRVTSHSETPGLGDQIDVTKSQWISRFSGYSLSNTIEADWNVTSNGGAFDTFTGATITPQTVVRQVFAALTFENTLSNIGQDSLKNLEESNR
tara:strand:- start:42442 stop:43086 length:645 start_codon:yes stop_codon:yes gene_type:complete